MMNTIKYYFQNYLGIAGMKCLKFFDQKHTPDNKLPGTVDSVLEVVVVRNPVKGWTEISFVEFTYGKKTIRKSISLTLSTEQSDVLAEYLVDGYKNQLPTT